MLMNAFFTVWWSCKVRRDRQQNAECQILCDRRTKLIKMSNCFSCEGLRARELDDTFHNLQRKNIVGRHGNHHLPVLQLINHHPHMFSWFTWITPFVAGMSMLITFAPSIFKRSERKVNYKIVELQDSHAMQCLRRWRWWKWENYLHGRKGYTCYRWPSQWIGGIVSQRWRSSWWLWIEIYDHGDYDDANMTRMMMMMMTEPVDNVIEHQLGELPGVGDQLLQLLKKDQISGLKTLQDNHHRRYQYPPHHH